jgi:hypothetical protein
MTVLYSCYIRKKVKERIFNIIIRSSYYSSLNLKIAFSLDTMVDLKSNIFFMPRNDKNNIPNRKHEEQVKEKNYLFNEILNLIYNFLIP